jgi:hypothetical protein
MYDDIFDQLTSEDDGLFKILKETLNRENLFRVNIIQPKILFLDCCGYTKNGFRFKSLDYADYYDELSEKDFVEILKDSECMVQVVVLSACPSNNLS